jgi:hypothetical protein
VRNRAACGYRSRADARKLWQVEPVTGTICRPRSCISGLHPATPCGRLCRTGHGDRHVLAKAVKTERAVDRAQSHSIMVPPSIRQLRP